MCRGLCLNMYVLKNIYSYNNFFNLLYIRAELEERGIRINLETSEF